MINASTRCPVLIVFVSSPAHENRLPKTLTQATFSIIFVRILMLIGYISNDIIINKLSAKCILTLFNNLVQLLTHLLTFVAN